MFFPLASVSPLASIYIVPLGRESCLLDPNSGILLCLYCVNSLLCGMLQLLLYTCYPRVGVMLFIERLEWNVFIDNGVIKMSPHCLPLTLVPHAQCASIL